MVSHAVLVCIVERDVEREDEYDDEAMLLVELMILMQGALCKSASGDHDHFQILHGEHLKSKVIFDVAGKKN